MEFSMRKLMNEWTVNNIDMLLTWHADRDLDIQSFENLAYNPLLNWQLNWN